MTTSSSTHPVASLPVKNPKFSVVIPAYNASAYIADCVNSVLTQTDQDFEVIVVDDGSTDQTAKIVSTFTDQRVNLVQRANGGLAAARNTGIAVAKGELVAFLDADDRWCREKLATHRQALDNNPQASVSYDWAAFIDVHGNRTGLCMSQTRKKMTHEALMVKNYLGNGSTSVVRRSVLEKFGGFDEKLHRLVDRELWVRLTFYGHQLQLVPQVLTEYRQHPNSFTADTNRMLKGLEEFLVRVSIYAPQSVKKFAPLTRACTNRWMARAAFVEGNYPKARFHASQSLQSSISVLWRDPRAAITFAAIAVETITPKPIFEKLLQLGNQLTTYWFRSRSRSLS